ncbi:MAG: methyltransferase domain-containing protein [Acidobacteriota bacterium]
MKFFRKEAAPTARSFVAPMRLHVGCGSEAIPGWVNIDSRPLPGVDRVLDVTSGLPFDGVEAVYAEHFLEHLSLDDGLAFLAECRRALKDEGVLRLSTPNLDWVYLTHYQIGRWSDDTESLRDCFQMNRAFHGWGHRFLYNAPSLAAVLRASGFATVRFQPYGESDVAELRGLERHETWEDTPDLPHVIIAEASGRAAPRPLPAKVVDSFREAIAIS